MPKSQQQSIFISLSVRSNKRKAIKETARIGFEYSLFIFSLNLNFLKPVFPLQPKLPPPFCSLPLPPASAKHSASLSATLLHGKQTFLSLNCFLEYSFHVLDFVYLSSPAALCRRYCSSYKSQTPETVAYSFFFFFLLQPLDHCSSIMALTFALHSCLQSVLTNSARKNRLKERAKMK